ncbi:MAG: ParB N-terminal domain-containing protein, partial [Candidatus Omnitrophica bacterium]|nr:ParB N-terminal domain-containing protein [Candidatus Omnitrophota bacterium]
MTDTQNIPLNKLVSWEGNVRKTSPRTSLEELESSIVAHGLLQSLVVRKKGKAKFAVIAGNRRLQALQRLAENDKITPDYLVSCRVIEKGTDPTEISLTENIVREQMHPADEFEAFRELVDNGIPAADVAARFGVTETVVLKRLKLARVSPVILAAYREDELTLAQVMAFTVTDDHKAQEQVLDDLSPYRRNPGDIRDALTENDIPATDRRVRFVTLAAYEEAGGTVRRDLFLTDDSGMFILDPDLLNRLAGEKLLSHAEEVRAEGWKWVEIRPCYDYTEWSDCTRTHERLVPLTT